MLAGWWSFGLLPVIGLLASHAVAGGMVTVRTDRLSYVPRDTIVYEVSNVSEASLTLKGLAPVAIEKHAGSGWLRFEPTKLPGSADQRAAPVFHLAPGQRKSFVHWLGSLITSTREIVELAPGTYRLVILYGKAETWLEARSNAFIIGSDHSCPVE